MKKPKRIIEVEKNGDLGSELLITMKTKSGEIVSKKLIYHLTVYAPKVGDQCVFDLMEGTIEKVELI